MDGALTGQGAEPVEALSASEHVSVSELFLTFAQRWPRPRITLGEMIDAFGMRSYGLLIVLLAIPNLFPVYIPGLSPIFGIPLGIVCLQLALGHSAPRLPAFLARRSMYSADLGLMAERAQPWLRKVEHFVRPRPSIVTGRVGERIIGAYGVLLALVVIVPLPLTNGPPSLACAVMAVGLMEEDTLTILCGAVLGVFAIALSLSIMGGVWWLLLQAIGAVFG